MRNEKINSKIITLWNKYFQDDPDVYAPLFYDEFKKGGLLFIGLNPSFSARGFKTIFKNTEYKDVRYPFFKTPFVQFEPTFLCAFRRIPPEAF
jgi:hypothetical protein